MWFSLAVPSDSCHQISKWNQGIDLASSPDPPIFFNASMLKKIRERRLPTYGLVLKATCTMVQTCMMPVTWVTFLCVWFIYVNYASQVPITWIMPHEFLLRHNIITMHKTLECINKKFIKRPILTNSYNFVTHKNATLWYRAPQTLYHQTLNQCQQVLPQ